MGKLKNKVILVTGASRGIGKGCVTKLLSEKASVIATDRDEALLEESHREWIVKFVKRIRIKFLDIASEVDWIKVMYDIEANEGLLHGLVNNAGIVNLKPLEEMSLEEFRETQDVNLTGTFIGTKLAVDIMRRKNNISVKLLVLLYPGREQFHFFRKVTQNVCAEILDNWED